MPTRLCPSVPSALPSPWRSIGRVWLTAAVLTLAGCSAFLRDTPTPMPTQATQLSPAGPATTLVVFLPGRGGAMVDFDRHGFTAALRAAGVSADTIAVDAHLGYYFKRTVIERLRNDVLLPARARGYRRIVLAGVSLGGLGALLNERDAPGLVDAVVLIAPYLGDQAALFEQIRAAGGPAAWAAGRNPLAGSVEEQLWTFLGHRSAALPPTWLLYGRGDSLVTGHQMLAALLPPARVKTVTGAHDWPTWLSLWRGVCLDSELFAAERADALARRPNPANGKPTL
ncbi:MAG: alpha/beta hydrolase [Lacunisphaera sp.]|nr:alpha/beta hydrolase [Lacunisphaera sp.]